MDGIFISQLFNQSPDESRSKERGENTNLPWSNRRTEFASQSAGGTSLIKQLTGFPVISNYKVSATMSIQVSRSYLVAIPVSAYLLALRMLADLNQR
jgi:hypothetical protein